MKSASQPILKARADGAISSRSRQSSMGLVRKTSTLAKASMVARWAKGERIPKPTV